MNQLTDYLNFIWDVRYKDNVVQFEFMIPRPTIKLPRPRKVFVITLSDQFIAIYSTRF